MFEFCYFGCITIKGRLEYVPACEETTFCLHGDSEVDVEK